MEAHLLVYVTDYRIVGPYSIWMRFNDGIEHIINFEPVLEGHYFGPLRDIETFNQVRLDPEIRNLVWPNDAAFDPATLYMWHEGDGQELAERAAQRKQSATSTAG